MRTPTPIEDTESEATDPEEQELKRQDKIKLAARKNMSKKDAIAIHSDTESNSTDYGLSHGEKLLNDNFFQSEGRDSSSELGEDREAYDHLTNLDNELDFQPKRVGMYKT